MNDSIANEIAKTGMRAAFGAEIKGALSQALAQVGCEQHEAIAHNMMERLCECYDACHNMRQPEKAIRKTRKALSDAIGFLETYPHQFASDFSAYLKELRKSSAAIGKA